MGHQRGGWKDGQPIADRRRAACLRPLTLPMEYFRSIAVILADAAEALAFAHGAAVIHRDIKPSNIMVDTASHCWLIDFGLAQCAGRAEAAPTESPRGVGATTTLGPMGTPEYMAPEQHLASDGATADGRSDVWGLGATLYELLTLHRPFQGGTLEEVRQKVLAEELLPPQKLVSNVPVDLTAICRKAMRKKPEQRYASAGEMAADLRRWVNGEPTAARPARLARTVWMWAGRNRGWATAIVCVLLSVSVVAVFILLYSQAETRQAELRASAAENQQRELLWKAQLQNRESLIHQVQRLQLVNINNGWSAQAWELISQAGELQRDERLRDLAAATLLNLDARLMERFPVAASSVAFDDEGKRLLVGGCDARADKPFKPAWLWSSDTGDEVSSSFPGEGPVAFDVKGNPLQLALPDASAKLTLWDVVRAMPVRVFEIPKSQRGTATKPVLALSPNATHVAASTGETQAWETASGQVIARFAHRSSAMAFSAQGDLLAVVDESKQRVIVWSLAGKKVWAELPVGPVPITSLAFGQNLRSPRTTVDHRHEYLAVGDAGGTITILDLQARIPVVCRGSARNIDALTFNSDGTLLASGGREETRLWDVATGRCVLRVRDSHGMDYITGLAFSPDDRKLAVSSRGIFVPPAVTVWKLETDRGLRRLRGLSGQLESIVVSPDGRRLPPRT